MQSIQAVASSRYHLSGTLAARNFFDVPALDLSVPFPRLHMGALVSILTSSLTAVEFASRQEACIFPSPIQSSIRYDTI